MPGHTVSEISVFCASVPFYCLLSVTLLMMLMMMAGKDGKKRKNKKRDVNSRTKAGHGSDMDVFIDEVSTWHVTNSH